MASIDFLDLLGFNEEEKSNFKINLWIQCILNGQMVLYGKLYEMTHRLKEMEDLREQLKELPETLCFMIRKQTIDGLEEELKDLNDKNCQDKLRERYKKIIEEVVNKYKDTMTLISCRFSS